MAVDEPKPTSKPPEEDSHAKSNPFVAKFESLKEKLDSLVPDIPQDTEIRKGALDRTLTYTSEEDENTISYRGDTHPLDAVQDQIEGNRRYEVWIRIPSGRQVSTSHPLTPFPDDTLNWESRVYDDGTT